MSSSLTLNGKTIDGGSYERREGVFDPEFGTVRWLPISAVEDRDGVIFRDLVDEMWPGHQTIVQFTPPPGGYRLTGPITFDPDPSGVAYRLDV